MLHGWRQRHKSWSRLGQPPRQPGRRPRAAHRGRLRCKVVSRGRR
ncbi:unnamed protein product [Chondrus crispus]|uniref:Uncharacterized protein n=1 Tax=Chondrus crispus TaxID=2769 RepID=R7QNP6_CHOCR|nr:unnamed protein product [Chondrus crispus]CDF38980.1 unnamed protein product [Chondrus crispus]|eukprot:XP_005718885.1 unnamed protein product [Chondrus crispus]